MLSDVISLLVVLCYMMLYLCCLFYVIRCYIFVGCSMLSDVISLLFVLCHLMLYLCCLLCYKLCISFTWLHFFLLVVIWCYISRIVGSMLSVAIFLLFGLFFWSNSVLYR